MTLILSGTNGLSDVDGSAATPAIRGTDTNTGIFFPAADTIGFAEGGVEAMRIDSSGTLLAGLTSSTGTSPMRMQVKGAAGGANPLAGYSLISGFDEVAGHIVIASSSENSINISVDPQNLRASSSLQFSVDGSERMRITSAGNVGIGDSNPSTARLFVTSDGSVLDNVYVKNTNTSAGTNNSVVFVRGSNVVGTITTTLSATAYNTSSDYRLKNITGPVTGSGEFIDALKPKVGTWKADGSKFVGFLAHEVQEVSPGTVTGTKDAVDEEGKPIMQAMEYGSAEFIANIIAELQSLRQRVAALESGAK